MLTSKPAVQTHVQVGQDLINQPPRISRAGNVGRGCLESGRRPHNTAALGGYASQFFLGEHRKLAEHPFDQRLVAVHGVAVRPGHVLPQPTEVSKQRRFVGGDHEEVEVGVFVEARGVPAC
ncbi:MAG: hypothetical protein MUF33_10085 [Candidatus Nanopelagicales bacterium]|nr:hypothetical protein [Candidatus Nanopelagicales bacterium]